MGVLLNNDEFDPEVLDVADRVERKRQLEAAKKWSLTVVEADVLDDLVDQIKVVKSGRKPPSVQFDELHLTVRSRDAIDNIDPLDPQRSSHVDLGRSAAYRVSLPKGYGIRIVHDGGTVIFHRVRETPKGPWVWKFIRADKPQYERGHASSGRRIGKRAERSLG